MPTNCCVPTCNSLKRRDPEISFHRFPPESETIKLKTECGNYVTVSRRQVWINKFEITKKVSPYMTACSLHFVESDYFRNPRRKNLKRNAIPSLQLPKEICRRSPRSSVSAASSNRGRPLKNLVKTTVYHDLDDTELENDMENYIRWKLTGGLKIMKKTAIPHRFDCQKKGKGDCTAFNKLQTFSSNESNKPKAGSSSRSPTSEAIISKEQEVSKLAIERSILLINFNPRRYIGLRKECMFLIDLVKQYTQLDTTSIFLTLQKVRLSQTFSELGYAYGMSECAASRTFFKSVSLISELMREFIVWPPKEKIKAQLPLPFRASFSEVQCIIDCFEIEIEKPTDAVKQALTWSAYKKANTLKYLVASTPDGVVNFISTAFGGRTSDALIMENSGFLDCLEPGAVIMADRGFKHIEDLLIQKQCTLLRPSSVGGSQILDEMVLEKVQLASLKIHIERVVRWLREFKFFKPHSCVSSKLIPYMDFITVIACGLINLQGGL